MSPDPRKLERAASSVPTRGFHALIVGVLPIVVVAGLSACSSTVSRYGAGATSTRHAQGETPAAPGNASEAPSAKSGKTQAASAGTGTTAAGATGTSTPGTTTAGAAPNKTTVSGTGGQSSSEAVAKAEEANVEGGGASTAGAAAVAGEADRTPESAATVPAESERAGLGSALATSSDEATSVPGQANQPVTQSGAAGSEGPAASETSGANLTQAAGAPEANSGGAASMGASGESASAAVSTGASGESAGAASSMGASGESAASEGTAQPVANSGAQHDESEAKLAGTSEEGADGLKAGKVAAINAGGSETSGQDTAAAVQQKDTVVGLVDVPGKKATVKEDTIPQTLGGMLPMTLGVDGEGEFDFDKAVVRPEVKAVLDKLAAKLKESQYDTLNIVGHADRLGTEEYNQSLSERRAWAVARYLMAQGVPLQKIQVEGRGVSEPLSKPDDCVGLTKKEAIVCLQKDRRVEIAASIRNTEVKVQ